jgi:hypothetical protein
MLETDGVILLKVVILDTEGVIFLSVFDAGN